MVSPKTQMMLVWYSQTSISYGPCWIWAWYSNDLYLKYEIIFTPTSLNLPTHQVRILKSRFTGHVGLWNPPSWTCHGILFCSTHMCLYINLTHSYKNIQTGTHPPTHICIYPYIFISEDLAYVNSKQSLCHGVRIEGFMQLNTCISRISHLPPRMSAVLKIWKSVTTCMCASRFW